MTQTFDNSCYAIVAALLRAGAGPLRVPGRSPGENGSKESKDFKLGCGTRAPRLGDAALHLAAGGYGAAHTEGCPMESSRALCAAKGFLKAMESLNTYTNHLAGFYLEPVPSHGDVHASVRRFIREPHTDPDALGEEEYAGVSEFDFELSEVADWEAEIIERCSQRFFEFSHGMAPKPPGDVAEDFVHILGRVFAGHQVRVWSLLVTTARNGYWIDFSEYDYIFDAGGHLYWLHLGVSPEKWVRRPQSRSRTPTRREPSPRR
jgi:hypothetical protein